MTKLAYVIMICFVFSFGLTSAQDRGVYVRPSSPFPVISSSHRVALVIGNGAYDIAPLLNPVSDARDISKSLREIGFEVVLRENLTLNEMKKEVRAFRKIIKDGSIALFYYAGHGIQLNGRNYLVPIGANIEREEQVEYESLDVGWLLAEISSTDNQLTIAILDACRNNPFSRSFRSPERGLAVLQAPIGTLIAYATAPGSVASDGSGRNGTYTEALLSSLRVPGLKLEEIFKLVRVTVRKKTQGKQVPWETSSIEGDFYFSGAPNIEYIPTRSSNETKTSPLANSWSLRGTLWLLSEMKIGNDHKPAFFEFVEGGIIKVRGGIDGEPYLSQTYSWYQTEDTVYILEYEDKVKKAVRAELKGAIKGNHMDVTGKDMKLQLIYNWHFTKVDR